MLLSAGLDAWTMEDLLVLVKNESRGSGRAPIPFILLCWQPDRPATSYDAPVLDCMCRCECWSLV